MKPPNGWTECPPFSDVIEDTYIAFKTPVTFYCGEPFTVQTVLDHVAAKGKSIGLWVDLTNTTKKHYYTPDDFDFNGAGIQYVKIGCTGKFNPTKAQVERFIEECGSFLETRGDPNQLIGVHCTHGFNRTGYMIAAALHTLHCIDASTALKLFAEGRRPGIYRAELVDPFLRFYGKSGDPPPPALASTVPWDLD